MLTLVQTADQGTTSNFCLWAAVVKSLSTPLQWRLGARICHLPFWRHIQPVQKRQTRRKLIITKSKRQWESKTQRNTGKLREEKCNSGQGKLSLIYFLLSMLVSSASNCRAEDLNIKLQISVN